MKEIKNIPVIILAGGLGTRLRGLVSDRPKVMADIHGRPFLDYILLRLKKWSFKEVILSVGYLKDYIMNYYGDGQKLGISIKYSCEYESLGTGGALIQALSQTKGSTVLALNGDTFFDINLYKFILFHKTQKSVFSIALHFQQKPGRYGVVELDKVNRVNRFIEKQNFNKSWINGGIYILEKSIVGFLPNKVFSLERDGIPSLVPQRVFGFRNFGIQFIDIGTPEYLEVARKYFFLTNK